MAQRKRIGIFFNSGYDFSMALVIYHLNIIRILNTLTDNIKPELIVIHNDSTPLNEIIGLNYPYLSFHKYTFLKYSLFQRIINKAWRTIFNRNLTVLRDRLFPKDLDMLFPFYDLPETMYIKEKIYWKPDFQEKYYPQYFSKKELEYSDNLMKQISQKENTIIFSSNDAAHDYKQFYPNYKNKIKLLRFSSFLPRFDHINPVALLQKYSITNQYFICPNQFWPHKNHITVLKAIKLAREKAPYIQIVFTGKQSSYRDENYFKKLTDYIKEQKLEPNIVFTGFIPREEQLALMQSALAVIQPSLFEGWSTVIEDAKAINQYVIASDLKVNREQIDYNIDFFEPLNETKLSNILIYVLNHGIQKEERDYTTKLNEFRRDIIDIFKLNKFNNE